MEAKFYDDINQFYNLAYPFLLKYEVENGILFGILNSLKKDYHRYGQENPILCAITKDDDIKLISIRTPPYNQILSFTNEFDAINVLVEILGKKSSEVPGVLGFKKGVSLFVDLWCKRKGLTSKIIRNERIYKLEHVEEETLGEHKFIEATELYENVVLQWGRAFILEALSDRTSEMIEQTIKRLRSEIIDGRIFLLLDNKNPVSMARKAGKSPNGIAVNLVYTPPHLRRKGYATECVAKLSKSLLAEGNKFCFLFTDLSNPTSNSIYQKIGYHPIIDVDEYKFLLK